MATQAIDMATIGYALRTLEQEFLGDCLWRSSGNPTQEAFLAWYAQHAGELAQLSDMTAMASEDFRTLNGFLVDNRFEPKFEEFDGVGVVALLDMLVKWLNEGIRTSVHRYDKQVLTEYPAFLLDAYDVDVFEVDGSSQPLARLKTKTGHSLWLVMCDEPEDPLQLFQQAEKLTANRKSISLKWRSGVVVPMVEFSVEPDVSWLKGLSTNSPRDGYHQISQSFQMFKLRMDPKGARVKVAQGVGTLRGEAPPPTPLVFNKPFLGFFTQQHNDKLPLAVFYADTDSWREPSGSLEDL